MSLVHPHRSVSHKSLSASLCNRRGGDHRENVPRRPSGEAGRGGRDDEGGDGRGASKKRKKNRIDRFRSLSLSLFRLTCARSSLFSASRAIMREASSLWAGADIAMFGKKRRRRQVSCSRKRKREEEEKQRRFFRRRRMKERKKKRFFFNRSKVRKTPSSPSSPFTPSFSTSPRAQPTPRRPPSPAPPRRTARPLLRRPCPPPRRG